ncbi:hypothetical protein [Sphingobacterium detergens]|uniref:PRTRC genetic system protein F n=1 Tax=Sphingobacterium detergens TaxID=1145106 RepID=A0A420B6N5_SPHD1|nr:hypothetical protein [Sphingobacterium detergens]RKE52450.1 hypothetical protein DFQ12_2686 [Sphingobacterium detergens]
MNYATQHHIGNYQSSRAEKATTATSTIGRVRKVATKTEGRKRSTERQTEVRTNRNATNGILKCTFLPKLKTAPSVQACQKTERDFYKSLSKLAEHYSIEPMPTKEFEFPYNITLGMWDMEFKVKRANINWDGFRLVQDSKKTYFMSEERYDTGTALYYIPIVPLYQMLKDPKRKKNAELLLSVCGYLYHIADIPYYRHPTSYLYWICETHKEWLEQEEEEEVGEQQLYNREFYIAEDIGDRIEQKLRNRVNLTVFEQRLSRFKCQDKFDKKCLKMASNAFDLYRKYPTESIFRNAPVHEEDPYNDDYENDAIGMEKYISFISETKGWLYECLRDSINNEFNEYGVMDEPTISLAFDECEITKSNLDFENRLFALLEDLCTILYDYKTTEK